MQIIGDIRRMCKDIHDPLDPEIIITFADDNAIDECLQCPSSPVARGKLNVRHTVYTNFN